MKRLSWQWVNRLLVLVALLLPIVYVVIWAFNLKGAGIVPQDINEQHNYWFNANQDIWGYIFYNNPLTQLGCEIFENDDLWGFRPIQEFIQWLGSNLGLVATSDMMTDKFASATIVSGLAGYLWWAFHVLLFDVLINGVTFFFRFIKKLMYMFEKED